MKQILNDLDFEITFRSTKYKFSTSATVRTGFNRLLYWCEYRLLVELEDKVGLTIHNLKNKHLHTVCDKIIKSALNTAYRGRFEKINYLYEEVLRMRKKADYREFNIDFGIYKDMFESMVNRAQDVCNELGRALINIDSKDFRKAIQSESLFKSI